MSVITARISNDLNKALTSVAKKSERSKSFIISKAIQNYVLELQENIEDYNDAIAILAKDNTRTSWEEVQRDSGLLED
jgi:predicted transcriptional regulator